MSPSDSGSEARAFWRAVIAAVPEPSAPPSDFMRPAGFAARQQSVAFAIEGALAERLVLASGGGAFLLYTTLHAAFLVTLYKHTGHRRLVVGSASRRTDAADTAGAPGIGHALPIVVTIDPSLSFRALLDDVRQALLDAYARQDVDPVALAAEFARAHQPARNPLFDVALRMNDIHLALPELRADLVLRFIRTPSGVNGEATYRTSLYRRATIESLVARYLHTLRATLEAPRVPITTIPGLTDEERQRTVSEWNATARELPVPALLHERIAQAAAAQPEATAIRTAGLELTFRSLDERANRLAHALQARGVGAESVVGVCLRRDLDLPVALLAVLKAGGAWLALDPDDPPARSAMMLSDAGAQCLISASNCAELLPPGPTPRLLLDAEATTIAGMPATPPRARVDQENLAYLIFTSGSTGRPKGVMVPHRAIVNYLEWCVRSYRLDGKGEGLVHGPITADLTLTSLFGPLVAGRAVTLTPEGPGVGALAEAIGAGRALSILKVTPTHLAALSHGVSTDDEDDPAGALVIGGEALRGDLVELWRSEGSPTAVWNEYGPTETTVGSCAYRIPAGAPAAGVVPIGRPIDNTRIYLLDEELGPVPPGCAGEICIGGLGVARGYRGRPDLTAERFVPDAFSPSPGARIYRSGDLGRLRPDGELEFLGRRDDQLKIRGFRVEPGEVESALLSHEAVREAVVVPREPRASAQALAAYIVPRGTSPSLFELRRFLAERLPEHMIPASFLVLQHIPMLPSGKVDRSALPSPLAPSSGAVRPAAPATDASPTERVLAEIWSQVLGLDQVGPDDNFFLLGGDSILSVQVVARAQQAGMRLHLNAIFDHPTLRELAVQVQQASPRPVAALDAVPAAAGPLPLPMQLRWAAHTLPAPDHDNQSVLLRLAAGGEPAHLEEALGAVVARHPALHTRFVREEGVWRCQPLAEPPRLRVPTVDLSRVAPEERTGAVATAATRVQEGIDLSRGEVVAAARLLLGDDAGPLLLVAVHHLVVDAISWTILLQDLAQALSQRAAGLPIELPPTSASPEAWGAALRRQAENGYFDGELSHWLAPARREMAPLPLPGLAAGGGPGSTIEQVFEKDETAALLRRLPVAHKAKVEEVLLAALALTVDRVFHCGRFLVDVERHGREDIGVDVDLARSIGWLASVHPLLVDVDPGASPASALDAVRAAMAATPRRGAGHGALLHFAREPTRSRLRAMPSAALSFNYLGRLDATARGTGKGPFVFDGGPRGEERSHLNPPRYALSLDIAAADDRLHVRWTAASGPGADTDLLAALNGTFSQALRELVSHCLSGAPSAYRPSDFDLVDLDQETLDRIIARVEER